MSVACLTCECPVPMPIPMDWACPMCGDGFVKLTLPAPGA
jgi:hypothetical protein